MTNKHDVSDAEAIASSEADPRAFELVFDRHFQTVHRFLARRCGVDGATDLAAETFARAFEGRAAYRPETPSALPWLLGIAVRIIANERRREMRQLKAYARAAQQSLADASTLDEAGIQPHAWEALVAGLRAMSATERDALLLLAWADLAYAEIAEAVGVPVGTVRSRLNRARHRLRAAVQNSTDELVAVPDGGGRDDR